jgi:hypothetical protein
MIAKYRDVQIIEHDIYIDMEKVAPQEKAQVKRKGLTNLKRSKNE